MKDSKTKVLFVLFCFIIIINLTFFSLNIFGTPTDQIELSTSENYDEANANEIYSASRSSRGIHFTSDVSNVTINPGETKTVNLTITNQNNESTFILDIENSYNNWLAELELTVVTLKKLEKKIISLNMTAPKNDKLNDQIRINITITDKHNSTITSKLTIDYFLEKDSNIYDIQVFGVVHSLKTSDKELTDKIQPDPGVSPGTTQNFIFEIINDGNTFDEIMVELTSKDEAWGSWEAIFLGITNTEEYLTEVENWDFTKPLDMSVHDDPVGYLNNNTDSNIYKMTLKIGIGQHIWIKVQITVPSDIKTTDTGMVHNFSLTCTSTDIDRRSLDVDFGDNNVLMVLKILFPDLELSGKINRPQNITEGEIITYSAIVTNIGDIKADNVVISLYVDGDEIKSQTINQLEHNQSRLIPFTWQATSGEHQVVVKADHDNIIIESLENNNELSEIISVPSNEKSKPKDKENDEESGFLPGFEISIFIIGFLMIITFLRRRKYRI